MAESTALRSDQLPSPELIDEASKLAGQLLERAIALLTPEERRQQRELDKMIQAPRDKATLTQLTDQAFRSATPHRAADQLIHILDVQGVPRFFSPFERTLLKGFHSFGNYLPGVAVPLVKEKMRQETANVILPAEPKWLAHHLSQRREEGVRMNVNHLGEALLGERQARTRLKGYLDLLQMPEIEVISVKISTIFSQISTLARRHSLQVLAERLELLYRAAQKYRFVRHDGREVPKFVYLDMEEYRDMDITAELFMMTLDRPGMEQVSAGMALQAYIPDSFLVQQRINQWARQRVQQGKAPVTLRIVKGANMEMERVEASQRGWPQAPYQQKVETDANYKRMLLTGLDPENLAAVRIGVASHNLLDVAFGLLLARRAADATVADATVADATVADASFDVRESVQFEMLEGMANHQRRALFEEVDNLLLYAPACYRTEFIHAIGYLVRRLDENTGEENFLRHTFQLRLGDEAWQRLERGFRESFTRIESLPSAPRRTQDRHRDDEFTQRVVDDDRVAAMATVDTFHNEPDTDFALPANVRWAEGIRQRWMSRCDADATEVPLLIGAEARADRPWTESMDPSRPGVVACRFAKAELADVQRAVEVAVQSSDWRDASWEHRSRVLAQVADQLRAARGDLIGAAMADGGKTVMEADPEVSEAIDFVEYYARTARQTAELSGVQARPLGTVAVVSPWNFPVAIPCGGMAAALAAGNHVLLKPASDTVLPAYLLCQCFWRGGVPREALQLVPCSGSSVGQALVSHADIAAVVLTGGTETALQMLRATPQMRLLAETGGKNATIVTALSDRDQAIKHTLHSAFSHSGQKCSATSLLLLEDEVYHDDSFRESLCDAVESLPVGSVWDFKNRMGPLIRPPSGDLERGLKDLEPGEQWAVMPQPDADNRHLYSPGVKWNVQHGSYTHMTEFFGPVLGVMPIRNLADGIYQVNATGYGLTSGLESLDDREIEQWTGGIRAGNLYVNRPTTGAIVHRQPFGGMGKSAFGAGIKAGGPNYTSQFMSFRDVTTPPATQPTIENRYLRDLLRRVYEWVDDLTGLDEQTADRLAIAIHSFERAFDQEFGQCHDDFRLVGQDNWRKYLPVPDIRLRIDRSDSPYDVIARLAAAMTVGCRSTLISYSPDADGPLLEALDGCTQPWGAVVEFLVEDDETLSELLEEGAIQRVRYSRPDVVPQAVREAASKSGVFLADTPILGEGRLELIWYVMEQSLSVDYHRYGNLGSRGDEPRQAVL